VQLQSEAVRRAGQLVPKTTQGGDNELEALIERALTLFILSWY
jgi:hypothetical protein